MGPEAVVLARSLRTRRPWQGVASDAAYGHAPGRRPSPMTECGSVDQGNPVSGGGRGTGATTAFGHGGAWRRPLPLPRAPPPISPVSRTVAAALAPCMPPGSPSLSLLSPSSRLLLPLAADGDDAEVAPAAAMQRWLTRGARPPSCPHLKQGFDLSYVPRTRSLVRTPLYKRISTKFSDKKTLLRSEQMNSENSTMFTDNYTFHCYAAPVHDRRVDNHADFSWSAWL